MPHLHVNCTRGVSGAHQNSMEIKNMENLGETSQQK
jgi:hypothetical protein